MALQQRPRMGAPPGQRPPCARSRARGEPERPCRV